jgi:hypothetical protein
VQTLAQDVPCPHLNGFDTPNVPSWQQNHGLPVVVVDVVVGHPGPGVVVCGAGVVVTTPC